MHKAALRDPRVWVLFFSFTKVFLAAVGVEIAPDKWAVYEDVFNAMCALLVGMGIFVYSPDQYQDDRKEKDNENTDDLLP